MPLHGRSFEFWMLKNSMASKMDQETVKKIQEAATRETFEFHKYYIVPLNIENISMQIKRF